MLHYASGPWVQSPPKSISGHFYLLLLVCAILIRETVWIRCNFSATKVHFLRQKWVKCTKFRYNPIQEVLILLEFCVHRNSCKTNFGVKWICSSKKTLQSSLYMDFEILTLVSPHFVQIFESSCKVIPCKQNPYIFYLHGYGM